MKVIDSYTEEHKSTNDQRLMLDQLMRANQELEDNLKT